MRNSVSDRSIYAESSDAEDGVGDQEQIKVRAEEDHDESDGSDLSSVGSPRRTRPNSYNTTWPQSYRQSIDIYSSVTPPTIGFLGTPNLSRLGSSFLNNSSFRGVLHSTPEIISSLLKPLLPTTSVPADQDEQLQHRKSSSHQLLPPRRPSYKACSSLELLPAARSQCSYTQGVFNGINVLCGVGLLSAPYAVKEGGWLGLPILFIYGVLAFYTGILLRHCLESRPGLETYPDIGQAAFGTRGRIIFSIILYLELYACCVEYIILESDNLSSLFPNAQLNIAAGGVIASIVVVASLFWVGLIDNIGYKKNEGTYLNLSGISIAIGLYGYAYSGHAVLPNIYSSLKKKSDYSSVLMTSFIISTLLFAGVAVMGFVLFGESTQSQFTLNLPHEFMASKIGVWTTVVNPITKYSITLAPMALSLEELMPADRLKSHWYAILMRTALTVSTLVVALSVPFFGLVMALIGSLLTMLLAFIFPSVCFLCIARSKATWPQVAMCSLVLVVAVFSSSMGTYSAIAKIIGRLS